MSSRQIIYRIQHPQNNYGYKQPMTGFRSQNLDNYHSPNSKRKPLEQFLVLRLSVPIRNRLYNSGDLGALQSHLTHTSQIRQNS